ncbi:MAG: DUF5009 domain-containing protein [Acidobacteria bacterium]|nr:DUF5009 domain-containing protein [Acidobacteriota bacterium]
MILVNDPGDSRHVYWPLEHAAWNGWTITDLVFPTFLFLVGCSIVFSIDTRLARGVPRKQIALQIVKRAALLFAIKMFISAFPHFHMTRLRIFGVLTRIAICYLIAALLYLWNQRMRFALGVTVVLLIGYWMLMRWVPVPGYGMPVRDVPLLDKDGNLAAYLDRGFNALCQRFLHTGLLYQKTRDPEGLLSTLPAVASTLLGILTAKWLRLPEQKRDLRVLFGAGLFFLITAHLWNLYLPINKNLWTSSYVLLAAGIDILLLLLFYWVFDLRGFQHRSRALRVAAWPWLVFGSNAIFAFVLSNMIVKISSMFRLPNGAKTTSLYGWTYIHLFSHGNSTANTSLVFAVFYVAICFVPTWLLWRRGWFLRV